MTTEIQPGTVIDGKYRIEESIGVGGFSEVFRATHIAMSRPVAIKIFDARRQYLSDPERAKRYARHFQREAHLVSKLQHPNTVTIFDYGVHPGGKLYLVMEFIQGKTLTEILAQEKQLSEQRTLALFLQVLASLEEAHHRGILHRDLKPANIMVTATFKGEEQVKVLDFGIAQLANQQQQHERSPSGKPIFLGTPRYAAPEQLRAGKLSFATDIFSVGALLWHCLLGRPMLPSGDIRECIAIHQRGEPWILPDNAPISPGLKQIIEKALHINPAHRFADASQMIAAIKALKETKQTTPPLLPNSPFRRSASEIVDPNVVGEDATDNHFIGAASPLPRPTPATPLHLGPTSRTPLRPDRPKKSTSPIHLQNTPELELAEIPKPTPHPPSQEPRQGNLLPTSSTKIKRRAGRIIVLSLIALLVSILIIAAAWYFLPSNTYDQVTETISSVTSLGTEAPEELRRSPFTADGVRTAIQTRNWRIESSREPIDMQRFLFHPISISRDGIFLDLTLYEVLDPAAMEEILEQVAPPNQAIALGHLVLRINPRDRSGHEAAEQLRGFLSLYRDLVLEEFSPEETTLEESP